METVSDGTHLHRLEEKKATLSEPELFKDSLNSFVFSYNLAKIPLCHGLCLLFFFLNSSVQLVQLSY